MRVFAPRELLPILCLHGTKHFWVSLGWLVDVAELLRRQPGIDAKWIADRAKRLGCERRIAVGLALARDWLGAPLPVELEALLCDAQALKLAAGIGARFFAPEEKPYGILEATALNLRLHQGGARRIRYALRLALAPRWGEWLRWRLPRPLFFLYFPLRLARLAGKYALRPFHRV